MNEIPPRRVIPRWRDSSAHLAEPEGLPAEVAAAALPRLPENYWADLAREKVAEWGEDASVGVAADALSLAVFPETHSILTPVARALAESRVSPPAGLQSLVRKVLGEPHPQIGRPSSSQIAVRRLRQRLRSSIDNPIALVDYARHQTALGNTDAAERAIRIACSLAPHDRFVLRSASRFYVHQGKADEALRLLKRSRRSGSDPWLLACDITVSSVAGRPPQNVRAARELLRSKSLPPEHLTELASAVATLELDAGRTKEARRLFGQSLVRPNDNAVSQVQWAAIETGLPFAAREEWLSGRRFDELRCLRASEVGDFEGVLENAESWHLDEPFSSRPMVMASHVNGVLAEFTAAESDARIGLRSNPTDHSLLNNLVYALLCQGKLEEGSRTLQRILQLEKHTPAPHTVANIGCLLIRSGDSERGIQAYRAAIERVHSRAFTVRALAFLARELFVKRDPQWQSIKAECEAVLAQEESPVARTVLRTIDPSVQLKSLQLDSVAKAGRWVYDKAKNLLILSRDRLF